MLTVAHWGAAGLFAMALKKFTNELKVAYVTIVAGLIAFSASQLQIPLLLALGLTN